MHPSYLSLLSSNNFLVAVVPGNCTDRLQPLDVSENKSAKDFLRQKFQQWYADKISESLRNGETEPVFNLGMGVVKVLNGYKNCMIICYSTQRSLLMDFVELEF